MIELVKSRLRTVNQTTRRGALRRCLYGRLARVTCLSLTLLWGCETSAPPDPPAVSWSDREDHATLMRFVHRDEPAWIRADLAALRSHAVLGTLFDVVEGHADPLSESVRTGDELLVVWHDLSMARRTAVVRGALDRTAVENAIRSGALTQGGPMQLLMVGDAKLWKDPVSQQAVTLPAANLLISGSALDVELQIARQRMPSSATTEWDSVIEGHYQLSLVHKRLLAGRLPRDVMALLEPATGFRLKVSALSGVEVTLRVDLVAGTDAAALVGPMAQLVQQLLDGLVPALAPVLTELIQIGAGTGEQGPHVRLVFSIPDALVADLIGVTREQLVQTGAPEPGAAAGDTATAATGSGTATVENPPP
ncbi:MAG: hypothetical protein KGO50_16025 [Myxococcales bacterium]|nr:hypothetical protein [Myxococcales bacterium]